MEYEFDTHRTDHYRKLIEKVDFIGCDISATILRAPVVE